MVNDARKKIDITSFLSQIFNERSVREIISSSASGCILTRMQQSGKEEPKNLSPALRDIYERKHGLPTQGSSKNVSIMICMTEISVTP